MEPFDRLSREHHTDVLIIGGGMAGVLCAYFLKAAGVSCLLVEANRIGSGVTGRTTAKITVQHGLCYQKLEKQYGLSAAQSYLQANQEALNQYKELCAGIACDFTPRDSYVYSLNGRSRLERELATLSRLHSDAVFDASPNLPFATAGAVRFPNQAQFHPLKFLRQISKGLPIYEHSRVLAFHGKTVLLDGAQVKADKIIIATHFPMLNKHGMYFLKLYQSRSYCLALEGAPLPDGMYVDESGKGLSFRSWGNLLLLGGGGHRTGSSGSSVDPEEAARQLYPNARVRTRWATQDCMSLDGIPYIGRYSSRTPDLYVATGFNKWGMTGSMVAAQVLTQLICTGSSPYKRLFSPSRTMLHKQLFSNAAEATGRLLLPTAKRCPHMGCALKWNSHEHSWDCPCHGSRFDADGRLLNGPATGDLPK